MLNRKLTPMSRVRDDEVGYIQMPFPAQAAVKTARHAGIAWIIGLNDWWLHCVHDQVPRNWDFEQRAWDQLLKLVDQGELVLLDRDTTSRMHRPACRQVEGKWVFDDGLYWRSHFRWHLEGRLQRLEIERLYRERWEQQRAVSASGPDGLPTEPAVIKPATLGPHVGCEDTSGALTRPAPQMPMQATMKLSEEVPGTAQSWKGKLRGEEVELDGVSTKRLEYSKRSSEELAKLRREFNSGARSGFLKDLASDPVKVGKLKEAGLSDSDLALMRAGKVPEGDWQVHHKLPLDDGGTNAMENLVLIKNDPYHMAVTNAQSELARGLQSGQTKMMDFPVISGFVYPPTLI